MKPTKSTTFRRRYIPIVLAVFFGVMLSILMFFLTYSKESENIQADINQASWDGINSIQREIDTNFEVLQSVRSLFKHSNVVNREEFQLFVESTMLRHSNIQALEWIPRVPHSQRKAFERAAQINGFPDFQITKREIQGKMVRVDKSEEYFPVYYVEPYVGNELALGFDISTNPANLEALNKACDTGKMIASSRITLVQEKHNQYGILILLPVYQNDIPIDTVKDRRENLIGFVSGVFRIEDMVEDALSHLEGKGIDIHISDTSSPQGGQFLYAHLSRTRHERGPSIVQQEVRYSNSYHVSTQLNVAGRKWLIECEPIPEFVEQRRTWQPWVVLVGGLLFTGLVAVYVNNVTNQNFQIAQYASNLSSEVAERKKVEKELKKYQDSLEELVNDRTRELRETQEILVHAEKLSTFGKMSASIAHEFSNPIYGIRNVLERLEKQVKMNGENKEFIDIAMRECNRMTEFIKRLQGFYRPTSDIVEATDIHEIVEEMLLMIQKKMRARNIELEKDYVTHMPEIEVVPDQIKQVVLNLLNNAIEATPESGGKIKIRTEVLKTRIKIHIEDSGCGITPENTERIFEPFFTSKQEGGTGLGLYVSHGIIKRHGGELKVKSKLDAGTTFTIMLPIKGVKR